VGGKAVVDAGGGGAYAEDGVALGEPVGEFLADTSLNFDDSAGIGGFPVFEVGGEMDVSGALAGFGSEFVDGGDDALAFEMPFDEEAIGGHVAMERTGSDAVEIGNVFAADGAETVDVEVRVFGFEWVEGPFNEAEVAAEGVFALKKFEKTADAAIAMGGENAGHVGMEVRRGAMETDVGLGKADHEVAIESAQDLASGVIGDDEGDIGLGIDFGIAPDFTSDVDAALKVGKCVKRTDNDVGGHGFIEFWKFQ
jgi:hypothetical protein